MKKLDIEGLLMPENYDELETKELKYKAHIVSITEITRPPSPIKLYNKTEILALEAKMKAEGKL